MLALARAGLFDNNAGNAREILISSGHRGTAFYCGPLAVADQSRIPASRLAPADFAREIFAALNHDSPAPVAAAPSMLNQGSPSTFCPLAAH